MPSASPRPHLSKRPSTTSPDLQDSTSSPVYLSYPSSRHASRTASPLPAKAQAPINPRVGASPNRTSSARQQTARIASPDSDHDAWGDEQEWGGVGKDQELYNGSSAAMSSDLHASLHTPVGGMSRTPLLSSTKENYGHSPSPPVVASRKTRFHERDPDLAAKDATRKKYTYAGFFLILSLISFVVQTETAVYIQTELGWNKAYCMLYLTHGSWSALWFLQLAILRLQKRSTPWPTFWRRHIQLLRETALIVQHQDISAPQKHGHKSPWPYMARTIATLTCALTVAGGSWYVAVDLTTADDLTAIYNCSAFFAYVFSIFFLAEKVSTSKVLSVLIATAGVFVVAYGGTTSASPGTEASNRSLGNLVISVGSVLYGFYEVLYKWLACPPDGTSPGRSMIFANFVGTCVGLFTLSVLWIPIPLLHFTGLEVFRLPTGRAAGLLLVSTFANAVFSGSFLVLISLTSPVLSSVAALLTIFLVALVSELLPPPLYTPLSSAAIIGGCLIIGAFLLLSWATYGEMQEERAKKVRDDEGVVESDVEGGDESD